MSKAVQWENNNGFQDGGRVEWINPHTEEDISITIPLLTRVLIGMCLCWNITSPVNGWPLLLLCALYSTYTTTLLYSAPGSEWKDYEEEKDRESNCRARFLKPLFLIPFQVSPRRRNCPRVCCTECKPPTGTTRKIPMS